MERDETDDAPIGIDVGGVGRWLADRLAIEPPLRFERVTGGHSNLTFVVTDAVRGRWVLRRPPVGDLLATAHDVIREHDLMAAVAPAGVPVPQMIAACDDPAVTGAPFYVMQFVDGVVVHTFEDAERRLPWPAARFQAGASIIDALAALHAVEPDDVGLGGLARRDGFLDRQLKRWAAQWTSSALDISGMDDLHRWLVAHQPPESPTRIVHGDYRLGNALLDGDGTVLAVLDWELCTLGEPLADVAYLLRSWSTPDLRSGGDPLPTAAEGFASAEELAARYVERSGTSLDALEYWLAFTAWRAAAILGGVYRRYLDGKLGTAPPDLHLFRAEVEARIGQGLAFAGLG